MYLKLIISILVLGLTACGSSDDGENSRFKKGNKTEEVSKNVALASNGGGIRSASYDSNGAKLVIDGDTTSANFWAGNTSDENFVIGFREIANVTKIEIYSSVSTYNTTSPPIIVELSTNQRTWTTIMDSPENGGIQCTSSFLINNKISCFVQNESAKYIRIKTTADTINIYEVVVTGLVGVTSS